MIRSVCRSAVIATAVLACAVTTGGNALAATNGPSDAGLFGAADPTYDGTYRQSLAILAFANAVVDPPADSISWLRDQQCGNGGWQSYRPDITRPCGPSSAASFSGPDTNSTGIALQALHAVGASPKVDPSAFIASAQTANGGFGYYVGSDADPNSTALIVQALIARGDDPHAPKWSKNGKDAISYLLSQQVLSCATPAEFGGIQSPFSGGHADAFASLQSVPALAGKPFPLQAVSTLAAAPASNCTSGSPSPSASPAQPLDAPTATKYAAGYVSTLIGSDGTVRGFDSKASVSNAAYAVLALSAAATGDDTKRHNAADWLVNNGVPAKANPATDNPGELALVLLANLSIDKSAAARSARIGATTVTSILGRIAATKRVVSAPTPAPAPTPTATPTSTATPTAQPTLIATPVAQPGTLPVTGPSSITMQVLVALGLVGLGMWFVALSARVRPTGRRRH